jgi:hypothetical protein
MLASAAKRALQRVCKCIRTRRCARLADDGITVDPLRVLGYLSAWAGHSGDGSRGVSHAPAAAVPRRGAKAKPPTGPIGPAGAPWISIVRHGVLGHRSRDVRPCMAVAHCCLQAGQKDVGLPAVHEPVDDLCKKALGLCAHKKCWGLRRRPVPSAGLLPGRMPLMPCA